MTKVQNDRLKEGQMERTIDGKNNRWKDRWIDGKKRQMERQKEQQMKKIHKVK